MTRTVAFLILGWTAFFAPAVACSRSNNVSTDMPTVSDTIPQPTGDSGGTRTYLALGDSYTIGTSILVSGSYPEQTVKMLKGMGLSCADPEIIATNGWTTTNLLAALEGKNPAKPYDIVTLLIGVNNQYQGGSLQNYHDQFTELLEKSIVYAGNRPGHVIVLSIPDYSVSPFGKGQDRPGVAADIDAFNKTNKEIALGKGVLYLNVTDYTRTIGSNTALFASDGLHYAPEEYAFWAKDLSKMIHTAVGE